jgi:hypothetical protein
MPWAGMEPDPNPELQSGALPLSHILSHKNVVFIYIVIVFPRIEKNCFIIFLSHKIIVQNIMLHQKLWNPQ